MTIPPLAWKPAPNSRCMRLVVRPGDPEPADLFTGDWWSGWEARIEWEGPGRWEWRVYAPLRHATGQARDVGEAPSAETARQQAARRLLELLPNPTEAERDQLVQLAERNALAAHPDGA
jgi:hypothetical protein